MAQRQRVTVDVLYDGRDAYEKRTFAPARLTDYDDLQDEFGYTYRQAVIKANPNLDPDLFSVIVTRGWGR